MKFKDCLYYSKKMNLQNSKESKYVIFGLTISMIFLILFGTISLAFYGLENSINKIHNVSSGYYTYRDIDSDVNELKMYGKSYKEEEIFLNDISVAYNKVYNGFNISKVDYPTFIIGDEEYYFNYKGYNKHEPKLGFGVTSYLDYDKVYLSSEEEYMKNNQYGNPILVGKQFENNANEIMVSDALLDYFNINDYASVINKTISCKMIFPIPDEAIFLKNGNEYLDVTEKYIDYEYYPFQNYRIIGVFNSNIYKCPSRSKSSSSKYPLEQPVFWIKNSSVMCTNSDTYKEYDEIGELKNNISSIVVYEEDVKSIIERAYAQNKFLINYNQKLFDNEMKNEMIQFNNVNSAYEYTKGIFSNFIDSKNDVENYVIINDNLQAYFDFYPYYSFIKIIMIFSIICLLIVVVLNIIRIQEYSLKKNVDFYCMNMALGMKISDINNIYLLRSMYNYIYSSIIVIILSIPICLVIFFGFENVFSSEYYSFPGWVDFEMPWGFCFVIVMMVLLFTFIILCITSLLAVLGYKRIMEKKKIN